MHCRLADLPQSSQTKFPSIYFNNFCINALFLKMEDFEKVSDDSEDISNSENSDDDTELILETFDDIENLK